LSTYYCCNSANCTHKVKTSDYFKVTNPCAGFESCACAPKGKTPQPWYRYDLHFEYGRGAGISKGKIAPGSAPGVFDPHNPTAHANGQRIQFSDASGNDVNSNFWILGTTDAYFGCISNDCLNGKSGDRFSKTAYALFVKAGTSSKQIRLKLDTAGGDQPEAGLNRGGKAVKWIRIKRHGGKRVFEFSRIDHTDGINWSQVCSGSQDGKNYRNETVNQTAFNCGGGASRRPTKYSGDCARGFGRPNANGSTNCVWEQILNL